MIVDEVRMQLTMVTMSFNTYTNKKLQESRNIHLSAPDEDDLLVVVTCAKVTNRLIEGHSYKNSKSLVTSSFSKRRQRQNRPISSYTRKVIT
jgi:hypothetical protein